MIVKDKKFLLTHACFLSIVNRRLDEWVPLDRVDLNQRIEDNGPHGDTQIVVTDLADSTDRKITRNQKRKHDEINHVQKVR